MGFYAAFLFSFLIGIASCQESSICDSGEVSLVPVTLFVTAEQYRACKEDGDCSFDSRCVEMAGHGEIQGSLEGKSYFEICQKVHSKMEQLEAEYPDVKRLKLKMIQMFDSFSIEFGSAEGELVSTKILNFLKTLIEKLKVELEDESNKVHKLDSIPVLKTILHEEEVTAEPEHESDHSILVGSIRGIPGIHFPNYTEIPITSFSCSDKTIIPGFYADLETGCQVFHLCYEHRRESFLCPIGTIFNQPILACDYWHSANCSQSPIVVTEEMTIEEIVKHPEKDEFKDFLKFLPVKAKVTYIPATDKPVDTLELKSSVTLEDTEVVADKIFDGILSLGSHVATKASDTLKKPGLQYEIPMSKSHFPLKAKLATKAFASVPLVKAKKITSAAVAAVPIKAKKIVSAAAVAAAVPITAKKIVSAAAVPIKAKKVASAAAVAAAVPIKAKKVASAAAVAAAVPIKAKKVASAAAVAAAVPIKAKKVASAAAVAAAVPIKAKKVASAAAVAAAVPIKAKIALPIIKTKVASVAIPLGSAKAASKKFPIVKGKLFKLPLAKTKFGVAAIPALKAKKTKALPYLKMAALKPKIAIAAPLKVKSAAVFPFMKAKLAKAAISPLTKKTLALGYLKLLKAKKLAVMG